MARESRQRVINLGGALTIERAAALRDEISGALAESDQILISLTQVEELDLSCLQILFAARLQARKDGKGLHFIGKIAPGIASRLALCGFIRGQIERGEDFERALFGLEGGGDP